MKHAISLTPAALALIGGLLTASCTHRHDVQTVDALNAAAYDFRYRNLDSAMTYAKRAYYEAAGYDGGRAEALNNMAFVHTAKMDYGRARELLDEVEKASDNQIELLIADVQQMRLCQRQSANKDFYLYRQRAISRLKRIDEERSTLNKHQSGRLIYAQSEYGIVASAYFYYVGLTELSVKALDVIDPNGEIVEDIPQLLNYYYNVGAGGIVEGNKESVMQTEFNYLMRCYLLSRQYDYPYWEANALQAISEHLQSEESRRFLMRNNPQEIDFLNVDKMPETLLAGNIARRALLLFERYGDVYQTAGAYRTLAECYWEINDYESAMLCLNDALNKNKAVENAPDLVASVREQLSLTYAALGDMDNSSLNRNIYLDMQEITRQDRQLEARAEQLSQSSQQLNLMILAVLTMIVVVVVLLFLFDILRRRNEKKNSIEEFLSPLEEWKKRNEEQNARMEEQSEEVAERTSIVRQQLHDNEKRNVEQRAKISLASSIIPFISRMEHEVRRLVSRQENSQIRSERYKYVAELTDKINDYNTVLTHWIQLRQGEVSLHIESFRLADLFEMVGKSSMEFRLKDIEFIVEKTDDVVKADKVLTLFMLNTIADNARRHTKSGGRVTLSGRAADGYVEVSIADTGEGIPPKTLENLFTHKRFESNSDENEPLNDTHRRSHGFGLMNCKGIIDKYKKMSALFKVCEIGAESVLGKGSRFFFRLPKGALRAVIAVMLSLPASLLAATTADSSALLDAARAYADSAYQCNKTGQYHRTIAFADSCISRLNSFCKSRVGQRKGLMRLYEDTDSTAAELRWYYEQLPTDYVTILNIRNECAVAALALHQWQLYEYNNKAYTKLFRERSADSTLPDYIEVMQKSDSNKNVAIVILVSLFFLILPAYYVLYYRHRVYYNMCIHRLGAVNDVLLSDIPVQDKLRKIDGIWSKRSEWPAASARTRPIQDVVAQIKEALLRSVRHESERQTSLELARDELRRVEYENNNVYVSNNVLDNCLSTLKHETMYYPSRIRQLIDGTDDHLEAIAELVGYYKELYTILNTQALRQIEGLRHSSKGMLEYLFEILRKLNGGVKCGIEEAEAGSGYITVRVTMGSLRLTSEQRESLFTPSTCDLRFLVCKQIVREIGEQTNARACGMRAASDTEKETIIEIILTNAVWKSLKSSS